MYSLIVLPGVTPQRRIGNYLLVDSKDFTHKWCCECIAGMQFTNIQIWVSEDHYATAFAIGRLRSYDGPFTVLLTESVWQGLEDHYLGEDIDPKNIEEVKSWCDIVEDLNGSN